MSNGSAHPRKVRPKERILRELREAGLPPSVDLTAKALLNFMNEETLSCHPGTKTLAAFLGMSKASVFRNLSILRDRGIIDIRPGWSSNRYAFWCCPPREWFRDLETATHVELRNLTEDVQRRSQERNGVVNLSPFSNDLFGQFEEMKRENVEVCKNGWPPEYVSPEWQTANPGKKW